MYAGQVIETGTTEELFRAPRHPYTKALLESNPHLADGTTSLPTIAGTVPRPGRWPQGCHFSPRCGLVADECTDSDIPLIALPDQRSVRCLRHHLVGPPLPELLETRK